jgi:UDP-3-O-[3-hydroxymyristoyl] glucosamine N-acyltransferase
MKAKTIAELVEGELHGDGETEIESAASISNARTGQIAFADHVDGSIQTDASCLIISEKEEQLFQGSGPPAVITVKNPKLAFARAAGVLHAPRRQDPQIHETAVIDPTTKIGDDVYIGPYAVIEAGSIIGDRTQIAAGVKIGTDVSIGTDSVLHPNVCIADGCSIGNRVILHSGVVIGSDGFGYVADEAGEHFKFPQIGSVVIEDNVEIGANTCIDRGSLGTTRIGAGTKIDNLVQVAHNVDIGERCVIAAETGISGSSVIGDDCVIGGQVGIADHVRIESRAVIGARSAVFPGKIVGAGIWAGTPVRRLSVYKREVARIRGLDDLNAEVKRLRELVEGSRTSDEDSSTVGD